MYLHVAKYLQVMTFLSVRESVNMNIARGTTGATELATYLRAFGVLQDAHGNMETHSHAYHIFIKEHQQIRLISCKWL
jgi:hypothetical protein